MKRKTRLSQKNVALSEKVDLIDSELSETSVTIATVDSEQPNNKTICSFLGKKQAYCDVY